TRFRRAKSATPISARKHPVPRGSSFSYSLNVPADVKITITRLLPGRRGGNRCRRPTHKLRSKPACVRSAKKGTLRRAGVAGANKVPFSGRIGRKALPAGNYRAKIVASVTGAADSAPRSVKFTIVKG